MKNIFRILIFVSLFIFLNMICFAQANLYGGGNGSIIDVKVSDGYKLTIRKHEQSLQIGDLAREHNLNVRERPSMDSTIINKINIGDFITISQEAEEDFENDYINVWLNISTEDKISGWILFGKYSYSYARFSVPYYDDRWKIVDTLSTDNKTWTIRKMVYQRVAVEEVLNIRDKPGVFGTKVISKIVRPTEGNRVVNLDVAEATEEVETIDGRTDRWLKISYQGIEGWIFGGYAGVERGGPKYYLPDDIIFSSLIDGP